MASAQDGGDDALDLLGPYFSVAPPQQELSLRGVHQEYPPSADQTPDFLDQVVLAPSYSAPVDASAPMQWAPPAQAPLHPAAMPLQLNGTSTHVEPSVTAPQPQYFQEGQKVKEAPPEEPGWLLGGATAEAALAALTGGGSGSRQSGAQNGFSNAPALAPLPPTDDDDWEPDINLILNEGNFNPVSATHVPLVPTSEALPPQPRLAPMPIGRPREAENGLGFPQSSTVPPQPQPVTIATTPATVPSSHFEPVSFPTPPSSLCSSNSNGTFDPRSPVFQQVPPTCQTPSQSIPEAVPLREVAAEPCDVSSRLLPVVKLWAQEASASTTALLQCSSEVERRTVSQLANQWCPVRPGASRQSLETTTVILKRCGVLNRDVSRMAASLSVCANHQQLLTSDFPVRHLCQICSATLPMPLSEDDLESSPARPVTPETQDALATFFEGLVLGQVVCEDCHKKVTYCLAGRRNRTQLGFVRFMVHVGLLSRDKFEEWMSANKVEPTNESEDCQNGSDGELHNRKRNLWAAQVDVGALKLLTPSAVPPLRLLCRGIQNHHSLGRDAPSLSVRDWIELQAVLEHPDLKIKAKQEWANRLRKLGLADNGGLHEMTRMGAAFRTLLEKTSGLVCKEKLRKILTTPCEDILSYPDGVAPQSKLEVIYRRHGRIRSLCLSGESELPPPPPTPDVLLRRHQKFLAYTCRICGERGRKVQHRCKNGEACDSKVCKYAMQDFIKEAFDGLDVRFEDNNVFPCKVCSACRSLLTSLKVGGNSSWRSSSSGLSLPKSCASFKPHNEELCGLCEHTRPVWCSVQVLEDEDGTCGVELETTVSAVPSLGLMASGATRWMALTDNEEQPPVAAQKLWRRLKVKTAIEMSTTLDEWKELDRQSESFHFFRWALATGAIACTSRSAFHAKVRTFCKLIERLQTDVMKEYPDSHGQIGHKIRKIVSLYFYDCDPKCNFRRPDIAAGIVIHYPCDTNEHGEASTTFLCCLCPADSCQGECAKSFKAVSRCKGASGKDLDTRASSVMQASPTSSTDEDGEMEENENPDVEASTTYSYSEDSVTFIFTAPDCAAARNFLSCQNDPSGWSTTEGVEDDRIVLVRCGGASLAVTAAFRGSSRKGMIKCDISGEGLEAFTEEIIPNLVKLTSSKLVEDCSWDDDEDVEGEKGLTKGDLGHPNDGEFVAEPTEMVFVEDSGPSCTSSGLSLSWRKPRGKSQQEFQCCGCGSKFKYKSSFLKHETKCVKAIIPSDVRSYPLLPDGRKPCPGCGKAFAGLNLFYLKHLRACPKIKEGGFPCKTCGASFSAYKTWSDHRSTCCSARPPPDEGGNDEDGESEFVDCGPSPAKQLRIESVVSLKPKVIKSWVNKVENHEVVCKVGDYTCPLCFVKFRLNQPYGKHLKKQDCRKRKKDVKPPPKNKLAMLHITIHPGLKGDDTIVAHNRIPSLRMMCRGIQTKRSLVHPKDLPPLTIKEALEVYYSLKRSDKSLHVEQRWKYLTDRFIFQNFGNSGDFMHACNVALKTVNFFEEKVKSVKRNPALKKKWNDKLTVFLAAPFHDHLNVSSVVSKFKAFEYALPAPSSEVGVVCLNCPNKECRGCVTSRVLVKKEVKVEPKPVSNRTVISPAIIKNRHQAPVASNYDSRQLIRPKLKSVSARSTTPSVPSNGLKSDVSKSNALDSKRPPQFQPAIKKPSLTKPPPEPLTIGRPGGTPNQRIYFEATRIWRSKEDMKKEYWRVGKLLGFRRPASLTEVLDFYKSHGPPPDGAPGSSRPQPLPTQPRLSAAAVSSVTPPSAAPPPTPPSKTFVCPNCPKRAFKSEGDLNRHKSAKCERDRLLAAREQDQAAKGKSKQRAAATSRPPCVPRLTPANQALAPQHSTSPFPESTSTLPATWEEFSQQQQCHSVPVSSAHQSIPVASPATVVPYQHDVVGLGYYPTHQASVVDNAMVPSHHPVPATISHPVGVLRTVPDPAPPLASAMPWMLPAEDCNPNDVGECILPD